MARLQADDEAMRASFLRMLRLVGCITIPLCVVLMLEAEDAVAIALSPKWAGMVPLLQVFAAGALLRWVEVLLPPVLFARYRVRFVFWWTMTLLACMPFVFWAGAAWQGAMGVALACVTVYPVFVIWMARESLKELGVSWKTIWKQIRPMALVAFGMAVCILGVRMALPGGDHAAQLGRLLTASGIGLGLYAWGIYWWGGQVAKEFWEVTGWLFRRPKTAVS